MFLCGMQERCHEAIELKQIWEEVKIMLDVKLAPVCGIYCGTCEYLGEQCRGCGYQEGKPFWTGQMKVEVCPLHDCCTNRRHLEHCGLCDEFPCTAFTELRDPSLNDEEAKKALLARRNEIRKRKEIGTLKWVEEQEARKG